MTRILATQENLKSRKCEGHGCAKLPSFGYPGERKRRCKAHMLEGMVRVLAQGTYTFLQLLTGGVYVLGKSSESKV